MKISFFIGSLRRGGAERVISNLANYYVTKGWETDVCLLLDDTIGYELDPRVNIKKLCVSSGNSISKTFKWLSKIRSYIKISRPDRVVSFIGRINVLVLAASIGLKRNIIISERNDPKHDGRSRLTLAICNLLYNKADKIVFQTMYEQSCFSSNLARKSYIIPNPVSVDCLATRADRTKIVTAGRLLPQKNHKLLIDAVVKVHEIIPEIRLDIYGDGMLKEKLTEQINVANASSYITLHGSVKDLHDRMSDAGAFVLTSDYEGLSNALIEAMMMGLPCISTSYDGADELICNGQNGILLKQNSLDELVEVICQVVTNEIDTDKISAESLKSSQMYAANNVFGMWDKVIEE